MPFWRVAANTYCQQQMGYGPTGFAQNVAGAALHYGGGGFGCPSHPALERMRVFPAYPYGLPGYGHREGDTIAAPLTFELVADPGTYTLTGFDVTPLAARLLSLDSGAYTLTGLDAALSHGFVMNAEPGVYLVTGANATLLAGRMLAADPGAYVVTGAAATLLAARLLNAETGAYAVVGADATLVTSQVGEVAIITGAEHRRFRNDTLGSPHRKLGRTH